MNGFMADIMGVRGCSWESPVAAASESLLSLFEFELVFELALLLLLFELLLELLFEFELELPPPTKFCIKSCNLPAWTGLTGNKQLIRHSEQPRIVANLRVPNLFRFFLLC